MLYNNNNEVFVSYRNDGLYKLDKDSLIKINTKKELTPWFIIPFKGNTYLVGSRNNKLELLYFDKKNNKSKIINDGFDKYEIIKTNAFLNNSQLYTGAISINDSLFAIGTLRKGIVIINNKGKIIENIDKSKKLQSPSVQTLFKDKQGGLWAGLSLGLSRVEYNSPFRLFDEKDDIYGAFYNIINYKNTIYASSNLGLYHFENGRFVGLDEFTGKNSVQVFLPLIFPTENNKDSVFFVTTIKGIYNINKKTAKKINSLSPNTIFQSEINKNIFYCGVDYELYTFSKKGKEYTKPKVVKEFGGVITSGFEIDSVNVWLVVDDKPVIFNLVSKKLKVFNENSGLTDVTINNISTKNGETIFLSDKGVYLFNELKNKFYKDTSCISKIIGDRNILQYSEFSQKLTWALVGNSLHSTILKFYKEKNQTLFDSISFKRLPRYHTISTQTDSLLWIISSKEIYKFQLNKKNNYEIKSLPIITKIVIGNDSVIFNGHYLNNKNVLSNIGNVFNYSNNNIFFEFAIPEFDEENSNEYKYILKSKRENKEFDWTNETYKEFSNLYEGKYVFMLKARNVYQKETNYISFKFTILPPWYRSWWAFLFYFIFLFLLIYLIIRINSRRLEIENIKLDNIVKERTAEIYLQKEEIQTQADNLEEINKKLQETNHEINSIAESLKSANENIHNKNIYITDSINYAKRIQKAILPSKNEISKILDEYFVIYKPKDIVGGDFYFFKQIKDFIIIASADCTGHGVPGGFLTMMGVSFLNEIVQKGNVQSPAKALDSLRQKFKQSLRQKEYFTSKTDGIDIALCTIDKNTGLLEYAGANSPIIIIRDEEVFILKPDFQPIGIYFKEKKFTLQSFQLKVNDIIYMFTDGFQDQFGGERNKKLLFKNLTKILLRFSKLPIEQQREKILKTYYHWKGDKTQIDDILLIGVKITKNLISI